MVSLQSVVEEITEPLKRRVRDGGVKPFATGTTAITDASSER
jgi:hypothetical protein